MVPASANTTTLFWIRAVLMESAAQDFDGRYELGRCEREATRDDVCLRFQIPISADAYPLAAQ